MKLVITDKLTPELLRDGLVRVMRVPNDLFKFFLKRITKVYILGEFQCEALKDYQGEVLPADPKSLLNALLAIEDGDEWLLLWREAF